MIKRKSKDKRKKRLGLITFALVLGVTLAGVMYQKAQFNLYLCLGIGLALIVFIISFPNLITKIKSNQKQYAYLNSPLAYVDKMSGAQFEEYLAYHFASLGYTVEMTGQSGDKGCDLIITKRGHRTAVQAKRYNSSVGTAAIQQIIAGKEYHKCHDAMVVTNSHFTKQAKELADKCNVTLWDREYIRKKFKAR